MPARPDQQIGAPMVEKGCDRAALIGGRGDQGGAKAGGVLAGMSGAVTSR